MSLVYIKKILPRPVVNLLRVLKVKIYDRLNKKALAMRMRRKHAILLDGLKGKSKLKVVFLVIHKSVWKVDPVFRRMLEDKFFDPVILVCPYTVFGEQRMLEDMYSSIRYFEERGYPVLSSYDQNENRWLSLDELNPDIVFFTNPHDVTRKEYYEDAYLNYLSAYVPYHHEVGLYENNVTQYDQFFHNAVWKIFVPHECSRDTYRNYSQARAKNVEVTGYPMCEALFNSSNKVGVWKEHASGKLKIIWAPHHTIDSPELPYSRFLQYAEFFKSLAIKYRDKISWSFKPHPILKSKLYLHRDWGEIKTDQYYEFWKDNDFSQLDEGEYEDLFIQSDAMIHDCGSFLAEYLYLNKPVAYMIGEDDGYKRFYNEFGLRAIEACIKARNEQDIENFITGLLPENKGEQDEACKNRTAFLAREVYPYFRDVNPSEKIVELIKLQVIHEV